MKSPREMHRENKKSSKTGIKHYEGESQLTHVFEKYVILEKVIYT